MAMRLSRSRLIATGLVVAALAAVGALAYAAIGGARNLPRLAAERGHAVAAASSNAAGDDRIAQARDAKGAQPAAKDTLPAPKDSAAAGKTPPARKESVPAEWPGGAATAAGESPPSDRSVRVAAPGTDVDVDKERGKVRVRAPYTKVDVDPDRGQVRVRAPYVNLDIRW
jgi:hypothetical protein